MLHFVLQQIVSNQTTVKNLIRKLQNPQEGLDKCYDAVSDFMAAFEKSDNQIPEKTEVK